MSAESPFYGFTANDARHQPQSMSQYKGKVRQEEEEEEEEEEEKEEEWRWWWWWWWTPRALVPVM